MMVQYCTKRKGRYVYPFHIIIFLSFTLLLSGRLSAQVKDSTVTGIYTDFKNYWTTSVAANSTILPDTSHNLLGFTFRSKIYSTGVNDATLTSKLGAGNYSPQLFNALPIKSIDGSVVSGSSTYIATAIKNDGDSTKAAYISPYPNIHIADVLTDGKNGLDLGTGVTNLPAGAHITFTIKSLSAKAATDSVPDLVFTQIADPSANVADTIFFYDTNGKLVGNKKLVYWNAVSKLGTYKLDLYTLTNTSCNTATINGAFQANSTRDIRMVAFLLTEFGITNSDSAAKVKGIQISPNGTSDQAFIAYNTNIISLDVPAITTQPANQTFCDNTTTSATFSVGYTSTTSATFQWRKNGGAIVGATSSSYTPTGLTLADTANAYSVTITNSVGSVTSNNAYVKYIIVSQPANQYAAPGNAATFSVRASGVTGYQWSFGINTITDATSSSYTITSASASNQGSYNVAVSSAIGTCTSSTATLTVENLPSITTQPQQQTLCSNSITSATFSVTATGTSTLSYQWYKNGTAISGATVSTYTASGLTFADTSNTYKVIVTSRVGSVTSSNTGIKYVILSQPAPATAYLATGNTITFAASASSAATAFQWKKGSANISGANSLSYTIDTVTTASADNYTLFISYSGGSCTSAISVLTTSVVLYSKATGNINKVTTWGVQPDGTGSTPVDFTRSEHTFIVSNRDTATTTANLTIAGTYDVGNGSTTISQGTTLEAGRIIRSLSKGNFGGTSTSGLTVHGRSDIYFDSTHNIL